VGKSKTIKWVVDIAHMGEIRSAYKSSVGKPGRPGFSWEDNMKVDLKLMECEDVG
jgi:hypothetical protein